MKQRLGMYVHNLPRALIAAFLVLAATLVTVVTAAPPASADTVQLSWVKGQGGGTGCSGQCGNYTNAGIMLSMGGDYTFAAWQGQNGYSITSATVKTNQRTVNFGPGNQGMETNYNNGEYFEAVTVNASSSPPPTTAPTTAPPTTAPPTTRPPVTSAPTTAAPVTHPPTTVTAVQTTVAPTTAAPSTTTTTAPLTTTTDPVTTSSAAPSTTIAALAAGAGHSGGGGGSDWLWWLLGLLLLLLCLVLALIFRRLRHSAT